MSNPRPTPAEKPSRWPLVLAAALYALWLVVLGVLAVLQKFA